MKAIILATALAAVGLPTPHQSAPPPAKRIQVATMCMKTGEQVSGMNKICYYDCLGSTVAVTIGATELCKLTINR